MASINLGGGDGDGDGDGYSSPALLVGFSSPAIETGGIGELFPPVDSVTSPAASSSSPYPTEMASSPGEGSDGGSDGGGGGNAVKKAVWSKLSNAVEVASPVMGAVSWPALGESNKAGSKSSSSESLQALSDGSLMPALQVTGNASSASVDPSVTHSGQRSGRRGGGISGAYLPSNRGVSQRSPARKESKVESPHNTYKESPRGGFGPQLNSGNEHHYQRGSYRRGYGGPHPRGGYGSYHKLEQGQGQGRGGQEWNQHRNFNNRGTNMQPQRGGYNRGGYIRPYVHNLTPFTLPPMQLPMRPFGNNVVYPDVASGMVYFQGPAPPMVQGQFYYPVPDPLHDNIVKQIDFYFSNDNLVKDTYLRRYMDEQGWVHVNLIAGFNKVSSLTDNVKLILDVMQKSTVVEVQGDKMRRRNDWMRWLMPPAVQDSLGSQLQGIRLDDGFSSWSPSGESLSQLQQGGGDRIPTA
ncbi:hypothetical protein L1987_05724 [Smallanthus sonchifolius]|uniref:Uncharacterized protein n=1 Tax=Smallanthus sonchifolius TaxID=185202 RepID=A0ACB9JWA2_9ASTR|nr:hypothetical protein L1987_05724 [Smallanthus sonchifolius]